MEWTSMQELLKRKEIADQTKKNKQKHNTICVGHNYAQANTNNLNHDTVNYYEISVLHISTDMSCPPFL
jgi:phage-related protein